MNQVKIDKLLYQLFYEAGESMEWPAFQVHTKMGGRNAAVSVMGLRRHGAQALRAPLEEASGSLGPRPLSAQAQTLHDLPTHLS